MRVPVGRRITARLDARTAGVGTTRLLRPRTSSHVAPRGGVCSPPKSCEDAVGAVSCARQVIAHGVPPCNVARADAVASIAAQPAVRDDRDPPLVSGQGALLVRQIRISVKWNILRGRGLTGGVVAMTGLFCPTAQGARFGSRAANCSKWLDEVSFLPAFVHSSAWQK